MANALIQIVDEQDNPIGTATKQEAWDKGLWHRIIRIMLIDENGRILLQKRAPNKKPKPNCWDDSVSGHVDAGESYLAAALRELYEELGIKAEDLEEAGTFRANSEIDGVAIHRFNKVYKLSVQSDIKFKIEKDEVSEVCWFTLEEALRLAKERPEEMTYGLAEVLSRYYVR